MSNVTPQFGLSILPWSIDGLSYEKVLNLAKRAEELGYDSIQVAVQFTPLFYGRVERGEVGVQEGYDKTYLKEVLDPLSLTVFIASKTERVRVGLNAAPLPLMPPFYWALYFTTLDILSNGRAIAGMCVGSAKQDFEVSGADMRRRGAITDEQLEIIVRLWKEDEVTFHGEFYNLREISLEPKPIQKPHPPILIGGLESSIPRALRYADYLCPFYVPPEDIKKRYRPQLEGGYVKIALYTILAVGDSREELEKAMPTALSLTSFYGRSYQEKRLRPEDVGVVGLPEECAEKIKEFQKAGVSYFIFDFQHHGVASTEFALRQMELFAEEVVPLL